MRRRSMAWVVAAAVGLAACWPAASATAQEGAAGLDAPAPPGVEPPADEGPPAPSSYEEDGDDLASEPVPPPPGEDAARYPGGEGDRGYPGAVGLDEDADVRIPSRIATRLRVLDADLNTLASRSGSGIVDGVLSILSGGLSITLGFLVDGRASTYLYMWGGANITRGIIDLALTPNASDAAIKFGHMPMGNAEQVRTRLLYGESQLERIAHRTRLARILDASINMAVGAAVIPVYLGPNDFEISSPFDYFVIIGSGISFISGVIGLVTRSEAEKRWEAYEKLRDRLVREERQEGEPEALDTASLERSEDDAVHAEVDAVPVRGGAAAVVRGRF